MDARIREFGTFLEIVAGVATTGLISGKEAREMIRNAGFLLGVPTITRALSEDEQVTVA